MRCQQLHLLLLVKQQVRTGVHQQVLGNGLNGLVLEVQPVLAGPVSSDVGVVAILLIAPVHHDAVQVVLESFHHIGLAAHHPRHIQVQHWVLYGSSDLLSVDKSLEVDDQVLAGRVDAPGFAGHSIGLAPGAMPFLLNINCLLPLTDLLEQVLQLWVRQHVVLAQYFVYVNVAEVVDSELGVDHVVNPVNWPLNLLQLDFLYLLFFLHDEVVDWNGLDDLSD